MFSSECQGQKRRDKPKNRRRRGVEKEMNEVYLTWSTMETTAQDRLKTELFERSYN